MATKSAMAKNKRREKYSGIAKESSIKLRKEARSEDDDVREKALKKLHSRRRDCSEIRVRNRCTQCGRPHGVMRRFKLCRICLRNAVMRGEVPGLRKGSW